MNVDIAQGDLTNPRHSEAVVTLLDGYARDPMGLGQPLDLEVRTTLPKLLRDFPTSRVWLAWLAGEPVGLAICFLGVSSFAARPLMNIHDLVVHPSYRNRGIGRRLLQAIELSARREGCCALTLEVRGDNPAQHLYSRMGFEGGTNLTPPASFAFWKKSLDE